MTNFEPVKNSIWDAAKADDKAAFDKNCEALMIKAFEDIWRMGWGIKPDITIDEIYDMLDDIAKFCDDKWKEAMECGDAPLEDVSPAEGIMHIKEGIQKAIKGEK